MIDQLECRIEKSSMKRRSIIQTDLKNISLGNAISLSMREFTMNVR